MEPWRAVDAHNGGVEAFKMEPWKVFIPMVADSYYFDAEQDPDPGQSRIRIRSEMKSRICVMRIRSTGPESNLFIFYDADNVKFFLFSIDVKII